MELTGDTDAWQISKHMENGIRKSKQSGKLKDQECFDLELWRKIVSFG
jgi:hypothetical protein